MNSTDSSPNGHGLNGGSDRTCVLGAWKGVLLLALIAVWWSGNVFGANQVVRTYSSKGWKVEDGLPDNSVWAVAQTPDGYIWAGTPKGLVRFDGVNFTVFGLDTIPGIKRPAVHSLCEASDGSLWIGAGEGLTRLKDGIFAHFPLPGGANGYWVSKIFQTRDGTLLLASGAGGVCTFKDEKLGRFNATGWISNAVAHTFVEDAKGRLWIGTSDGLWAFKDGRSQVFYGRTATRNTVRSSFLGRDGALWFGCSEGLIRIVGTNIVASYDANSGLSSSYINSLLQDEEGDLWIGSFGGLSRYSQGMPFEETTEAAKLFDQVNDIVQDREGNIWLGTLNGLHRLSLNRVANITMQQGLLQHRVKSVCEDKTGALWTAGWGGLNQLVGRNITTYPTRKVQGLTSLGLATLCSDHAGNLWIGTEFRGRFYCFCDGKCMDLQPRPPAESYATSVTVIFEDREQDLWFGTAASLLLRHAGKFQRFTTADGLPGKSIHAICQDGQGTLWFGTESGLAQRKQGHFNSFTTRNGLSANNVLALFADHQTNLWIGTSRGLNRLKDGKFTAYTTHEGLHTDEVLELVEDDFGNLWMGTSTGIFYVSKKDLDAFDSHSVGQITSVFYGGLDGMESSQCTGEAKPGAIKDHSGRLWFATIRGLVSVDPKAELGSGLKMNGTLRESAEMVFDGNPNTKRPDTANKPGNQTNRPASWTQGKHNYSVNNPASKKAVPRIVIEAISSTSRQATNTWSRDNLSARNGALDLPPGKRELEIRYTALQCLFPEQTRFKYRLEGFSQDWVDAGTRRVAYYPALPPAHYRFQVIGCSAAGIWNTVGDSLEFHLEPSFYQTAWFQFVCGLAICVAAVSIHRLRVRGLRARERKLNVLVAQRTREIEDAHKQLLQVSHQAGMAEVATTVLHNVGNVLNSVNVSVSVLRDHFHDPYLSKLARAADMLEQHRTDLVAFLSQEKRAESLVTYLRSISEHLASKQSSMLGEVDQVVKNVDHIKEIVAMQQKYARVPGVVETVKPADLVEDALSMHRGALARHDVQVVREFETEVPEITVERHKVLQILENLIHNAKDACDTTNRPDKQMTLRLTKGGDGIGIAVIDNGVGIPAENLTRIFQHGFTTRKEGHGFGLHSAALAARDLGGSLRVRSDGPGKGACFTLELPLRPKEVAHHMPVMQA